jgi:hypothetical protein
MTQHKLNLLPTSVRLRNQAGMRAGRYATILTVAVAAVVVLATHSRFQLDRAEKRCTAAETEADYVLQTEAKLSELRRVLDEGNEYIARYHRIAPPLDVSRVLATLFDRLPASVSLDRLDIDAGVRHTPRTARSRASTTATELPSRVLSAEIAGFAPSDEEIAELVAALENTLPFEDVSLDFSRTRAVRGHVAREFRLSFRIDLERRYVMREPGAAMASVEEESE